MTNASGVMLLLNLIQVTESVVPLAMFSKRIKFIIKVSLLAPLEIIFDSGKIGEMVKNCIFRFLGLKI